MLRRTFLSRLGLSALGATVAAWLPKSAKATNQFADPKFIGKSGPISTFTTFSPNGVRLKPGDNVELTGSRPDWVPPLGEGWKSYVYQEGRFTGTLVTYNWETPLCRCCDVFAHVRWCPYWGTAGGITSMMFPIHGEADVRWLQARCNNLSLSVDPMTVGERRAIDLFLANVWNLDDCLRNGSTGERSGPSGSGPQGPTRIWDGMGAFPRYNEGPSYVTAPADKTGFPFAATQATACVVAQQLLGTPERVKNSELARLKATNPTFHSLVCEELERLRT